MSELRIDYSGLTAAASAIRRRGGSALLRSGAQWSVGVVVLATLPFILLVRGGVVAYQVLGFGTWPSLFFSALSTIALLAAYAYIGGYWLGAGLRLRLHMARGAMGIAGAYLIYALLFVASANAKSAEVRSEYRSLHPLLRLASSAVILVDPASVITDGSRVLQDYAAMGLPARESSLHFVQSDGYVHALDLRTNGRSALRNFTVALAFRTLGLTTLRHGGTGDHIHVSLALAR